MNQIIALQRANKELKENLQEAVALASKFKREMGVIDQEDLARLNKAATGAVYNPADFDLRDRNGEQ